MNNQDLFDRILAHSRKMTCQSRNGPTCQYRSKSGDMCFVGALIRDDVYAEYTQPEDKFGNTNSLEGRSIDGHHLLWKALETSLGFHLTYDHIELLNQLQQIHDNAFETREAALATYADRNNLVYKKEEE